MGNEHKFLPAIVALSASLVMSLVLIISRVDTLKALIIVLLTLLGFYIIGAIFKGLLNMLRTKPEPVEVLPPEEEEVLEDLASGNEDE